MMNNFEVKNQATIKLIGKKLKLSDDSNIYFKGGDCFLVYPNGKLLLLLEFKLIRQKRKKFIDIKRCLLCDEGIGKNEGIN